ncbi:hypothetical protein NMY22_g16272 [Coprinellus aureogranulatus]|nr:hypothetical protein NMY22_g16272 [Coprinellus aureogranulatus]
MLDLAILWWTAVHHGDPIVYPNGKFLGAPIVDEVGDHALELFYQLATENPSGMAEAVLEGTLCDPQHFIKQTASRIRHLPHLNRLENLKHLPEGTVELGNAQYIVLVMDTLVTNEGRLHSLVMSSPYTVNCFMQTLTVMSSTLYNQQSPSSDREVEERVLHLLQPLKLAQHVVNWVLTAPTNVVCGARTLMEAGLFDIMANYIPFVSDEIHTEVETILAALVPYALYPPNMRPYLKTSCSSLLPRLLNTPTTSYRKGKIHTDVAVIRRHMGFLDECNQEGLCDNLRFQFHPAHSTGTGKRGVWNLTRARKKIGKHFTERNAARCTGSTRMTKAMGDIILIVTGNSIPTSLAMDGTPFYRPENVQTAAGLLFMDPDADGRRSGPVDEYLRKTCPYIPGYLKPRYEALASIFRKSVEGIPAPAISLDFKRRTTKPHIGSFRIIERVFRLGATDQVLILLMEQVRDLPDAYGTHEEMSDQVDIFCNRGAIADPYYTIIGSVNYTIPGQAYFRPSGARTQEVIRQLAIRKGVVKDPITFDI